MSGREDRRRGRFQATREGAGFIVPECGGPDLFVPAAETNGALHGDRVAYRVTREAAGRLKAEAAVTSILERRFLGFTGEVAGTRKRLDLIPDPPRPPRMRLLGRLENVEPGQRVLCRLHDARDRRPPGAMLERILGDADDPRLDAEIVRAEFALPRAFPADALAEAHHPEEVPPSGRGPERRDFAGELVITIDPADARDFDDAVSLRADPGGGWLLRVHIADVASAVAAGGALDAEAARRGNSTYLPGLTIPMLPEILSTGRMSLSPKARKAVLTVSARIGTGGQIRAFRIDEGLIRSRCRLDYDRVQAVLDGNDSVTPTVDGVLRQMHELAQALRARRLRRGGFDLEVPEVEVTLDERAFPLRVERRTHGSSHEIIEEFMILANRLACGFAVRRGHPYLYRVHPAPDPVGLAEFCACVRTLAPEASGSDLEDLSALRRWIGSLPREPRTWRIHALLLRAFERARYAERDSGHFGLGLRGYGHFTSPIRRYPDLFNHRIVKWAIHHGRRAVPAAWRDAAAEVARHCTASEERSELAERQLLRIKSLRWAQARLGSSYHGTVVAIVQRGLWVELDAAPIDGLVPREDVDCQGAGWDRGPLLASGRGGLQVGTPVIVQIARVDLRRRTLVFALRAMGRRALDGNPERMEPLVGLRCPGGRRDRAATRRAGRGRRAPRREGKGSGPRARKLGSRRARRSRHRRG